MTQLWPAVLVVWLTVVAGSATSCERATTCNVTSLKLTGRSLLQQSEVKQRQQNSGQLGHDESFDEEADGLDVEFEEVDTSMLEGISKDASKNGKGRRNQNQGGKGRSANVGVGPPPPPPAGSASTLSGFDTMVRFDSGHGTPGDMDLFNAFDKNDLSGSAKNYNNIMRPLWQKTLACAGPNKEDCFECDGELGNKGNCWYNCRLGRDNRYEPRCVQSSGDEKLRRFLTVIHLKCPTNNVLYMQLKLRMMSKGTLRAYWDQTEIDNDGKHFEIDGKVVKTKGGLRLPFHEDFAQYEDTDDLIANSRKAQKGKLARAVLQDESLFAVKLPFTSPSGHVFTLEFESTAGERGRVQVENLRFFTTSAFTECMDAKVCLNTLQAFGQAGVHLRNNNAAQRICLSGQPAPAAYAEACDAWRGCLETSGKADALLALLTAAKVQSKEVSTGSSDKNCLDPATEDPESWDCDCYDSMRDRCEKLATKIGEAYSQAFESICLRAEYCIHPNVCAGWKAAACSPEDVIIDFGKDAFDFLKVTNALRSESALIGRASGEAAAATMGNRSTMLDSTTGTKNCL